MERSRIDTHAECQPVTGAPYPEDRSTHWLDAYEWAKRLRGDGPVSMTDSQYAELIESAPPNALAAMGGEISFLAGRELVVVGD